MGDQNQGHEANATGSSTANGSLGGPEDLSEYPPHSIAVVGMAGRFPDADTVDELWEILLDARSTLRRADVERLQLPKDESHADTAWWGNWIRDPDAFDHVFFKKSSREAVAWDPQQRVLLQVVYEALESTGHFSPSSVPEADDDYGCYIGAVMNSYYDNLSCHPPTTYATLGTGRCFLSGCMSHYFGFTGPSMTIDTACSSSLVAIDAACRAIWSGGCSRAIAGGTNVISSPGDYRNLHTTGFLSPSGQCKPFDRGADGYCRGEGVGVVVLKRLADAVREHDNVLGVIVGSAVNQNGNASHITVPQSGSQMDLYHKVMKLANVTPGEVTYVEAHGTGTGVGDPVEVRGIRDAYGGPTRDSLLHFGSIKGNIGHTESAAGVSGLIKVLLMMRHGTIPRQASYRELNPTIPPLEPDQMAIPTSAVPWNPPTRLACVNSHGAAGSNSALLVRGKPRHLGNSSATTPPRLGGYPLVIRAASANSLAMYSKKLLAWIREHKGESTDILASLTFNLADRANHELPHILATSVSSIQDLEAKLEGAATSGSGISQVNRPKPVVLVFGGQESDFIGLSRDVYLSSKVFRHHLDRCDEILVSRGLESLYPAIFARQEPIESLTTLHAALFAVQYASAQAWLDCGLKVDAVVGHSFGQLTALCVSGCLSLPDALALVVERAALMSKHWGKERGTMLFLDTDRGTVDGLLVSLRARARKREDGDDDDDDSYYAEIACYNGPRSHVVVGSSSAIENLEREIANTPSLRNSVRAKRLQVTHGFHSKFTEPLLSPLTAVARQLEWRTPTLHLELCSEEEVPTSATARGPPDFGIVAEHTRRPVFFQHAVERLAARFASQITWLEAGRGSSVMQLVRGSVPNLLRGGGHTFLSPQLAASSSSSSSSSDGAAAAAQGSLTETTIGLWKAGGKAQYWTFHRSQKPDFEFLSLPPYQFEKTRHWLPYIRRGQEQHNKQAQNKDDDDEVEDEPKEMLKFLRFKDEKSKKEAVFRVDPRSARFEELVGGHIMAGQALVPGSLYVEILARAALFLQRDPEGKEYVPVIEDLAMKYPIGVDTSMEITLVLNRVEDARQPCWAFTILTKGCGDASRASAEPSSEQSRGIVRLKPRTDARAAREFRRFESVTGARRCEEVLSHPDSEKMQGKHIYRAFGPIVQYGDAYRGVKEVAACVGGTEAAARVVYTPPDAAAPVDERLCDTLLVDSLLQLPGMLVNYFQDSGSALGEVLLCTHIERIEFGGSFTPDAKEWLVYAKQTVDEKGETGSDAYVFEARSGTMVMAVFGCRFMRMQTAVLGQILRDLNQPNAPRKQQAEPLPSPAAAQVVNKKKDTQVVQQDLLPPTPTEKAPPSKRLDLFRILSNVTDLPLEDIDGGGTLIDFGIDSLMATEVLRDIRTELGPTIDLTTFLLFPNIDAIVASIDRTLGVVSGSSEDDNTSDNTPPSLSADDDGDTDAAERPTRNSNQAVVTQEELPERKEVDRPTLNAAFDDFQETRLSYDALAKSTGATGFWSDVYPQHARLVLAYVVEAFARLGCDCARLQPGDRIPEVQVLAKHQRLMRQLHRILEDGKLISSSSSASQGGGGFVRTDTPVDSTPAESIYRQIIGVYPQHDTVTKMIKTVGSQLAGCLVGEQDGLQVVFGDKEAKKTMEELYAFWPLVHSAALLLGDFLHKAFTNSTTGGRGKGKFRILEVGAGTGGTTRYIVDELRRHGIPFEYVFTDISSSLVAAARKRFRDVEGMSFALLDIEKPAPAAYRGDQGADGAFHCIIATNCVHATRELQTSLSHCREMLRPDGVLALVEMTRPMFSFDIIVGLFEGWWLFQDDRVHALVDEQHWERAMLKSGFGSVLWSDGDTPEAKTVRVVAAFPQQQQQQQSSPSEVEVDHAPSSTRPIGIDLKTVVYKTIGEQEIHADIYYPSERRDFGDKKLPIALMIHGGSHTIFSRKDIRPAQTNLLLQKGFLPVSLDHRLCPEVSLAEGPMADIRDALHWARHTLPRLALQQSGLPVDGERVVVIGWSSGGQLAMSLAWTAPQPPEAILAFYPPTDYEDEWWRHPIQPIGAADKGEDYDVLEAVRDAPITNYGRVGAWEPLSDERIHTDARARIVLHINWKAQTLPVILGGLPSRRKAAELTQQQRQRQPDEKVVDWHALPQPSSDTIVAASALAQIRRGRYRTPTFLVHGTADDLIPWQQSRRTYDALVEKEVDARLVLVEGAPHVCDLSSDPESEGWKATVVGYEFLSSYV